jgi:hypothetical protein
MSWERDSQSSPHHWQHALQTEGRLTRLEVTSEDHEEKIGDHDDKHDAQDVWNRGFTLALAGLGAGLMHAKAGDVLGIALELLARFRS